MKKRFVCIVLAVMLVATTMTFTGCSVSATLPETQITVEIPDDEIFGDSDGSGSTSYEEIGDYKIVNLKKDWIIGKKGKGHIGPVTVSPYYSGTYRLSFIVDVNADSKSSREEIVDIAIEQVLKEFGVEDYKVQDRTDPVNGYNYIILIVG